MRYGLVIFCLWITLGVQAQPGVFGNEWLPGRLILSPGDTLAGTLRLDLPQNLAQIMVRNTVKTYSARQFQSLSIYDSQQKKLRQFYVLPYAPHAYRVPTVFEVLTEGTVTLLGREKIVTQSSFWGNRVFTHSAIVYDFYLGLPTGKVVYYKGTQRDFKRLLPDPSGKVEAFVQTNQLQYNHPQDLIRIIVHYNYLNHSTNRSSN